MKAGHSPGTPERMPIDEMRIAQLVLTLRPGGGAESLALTFAQAVQDRPVELHVISLREHAPSLEPEIAATGARVASFPGRFLPQPSRFLRLCRYLKRHQFDILHSHLTGANILTILAGRWLQIPVVVTLHNTRMRSQQHWLHGKLESWLINRWAAAVIAVGWQTAAAHARRLPAQQILTIPNAVPPPRRRSSRTRSRVRTAIMTNPQRYCLLAVGRLSKQKRHNELISAFHLLLQTCPECELVIAGTGPEEAELRRHIIACGLETKVRLLGLRRDIAALMQAADLFVSASHWEGLPVAVLEAMSSGLPLVITRVGDVGHVVTEEMGWLLPAGQPTALAQAMADALQNRDQAEARARRAQKHVSQSYSAAQWAEQQLALYRELISNRESSHVSS